MDYRAFASGSAGLILSVELSLQPANTSAIIGSSTAGGARLASELVCAFESGIYDIGSNIDSNNESIFYSNRVPRMERRGVR